MPKYFISVKRNEDALYAKLHEKGWRTIKSINGVEGLRIINLAEELYGDNWEKSFNKELPKLMAAAASVETDRFEVLIESADGEEETVVLESPLQLIRSVKQNFAGIVAVGRQGGLTDEDLAAAFTSIMMNKEKHHASGEDNDGGLPEGLMENLGFAYQGMSNGFSGQNAKQSGDDCVVQ